MSKNKKIIYEDHLKRRDEGIKYVHFINEQLRTGTRESLWQFVLLYGQEDFLQNYQASWSELISGRVLAMIAYDELRLNLPSLYTERFRNIDEFIPAWDELKFQLWELEFWDDEEVERNFIHYVREHDISDIVLRYLVHTSAVDEKKVLFMIINGILSIEKDIRFALRLCRHGIDLCPGDEDIPVFIEKLQAVLGE